MDFPDYELLDFGDGRKLERFGDVVLDRPAPSAEGCVRSDPISWPAANARFDRTSGQQGRWTIRQVPDSWGIRRGPIQLELKLTPFGHLGVFPEQAANWDWIAAQVARAAQRPKILNLFAYTGGSTLAAAAAGAEVVHVDAARNVVQWARRNAERSGLAGATIRWITEDALTFVSREVRRGNSYDAVILDPPSYGHGPQGESWVFERDLPLLLDSCRTLLRDRGPFLVLTCHSPGVTLSQLSRWVAASLLCESAVTSDVFHLTLRSPDQRELPSGMCARWGPP